ncbi:hypothetical protein KR222_011871 [Zaprionus bogoriensis]|nr:hypothetical protein KR222_011871 [Zaprionus bogoriensis]
MEYKRIAADQFEQVIDHLRMTFFSDEPLNRSVGLCQRGECNKELEEHCLNAMREGLSVMAVDAREGSETIGQIAGVVLNGVLRAGDEQQALDNLPSNTNENYRKIFRLLYTNSLKVDLFACHNVDRVFDVRILSVDSRFRGHGIAKELVCRAEQVAHEAGFRLLRADATGMFSQKILRSQGFEPRSEKLYAKYTDEQGCIILPVEAPHIKLQLLTKELHHKDDSEDVDEEQDERAQ